MDNKTSKISNALGAAALILSVTMSFAALVYVTTKKDVEESKTMTTKTKKIVRFATFNLSFDRSTKGELETELSKPWYQQSTQVKNISEIIQINKPDVILLNEFNYDQNNVGIKAFQKLLRENSFGIGNPINYPYFFSAPSNTGVQPNPPLDIDSNGKIGKEGTMDYANDSFGFGQFPGKYGMAILSKYPIVRSKVRTFRKFLWKDMPNALLPDNDKTAAKNDFYSQDVLNIFRLSSKSHWDVPIMIGDKIIHVLASHPTPPTFDGAEDKNGKRNYDEIRLWADYIGDSKNNQYIYDDNNKKGGIEKNASFVIMGDMNADPVEGDSRKGAINQLLDNPRINTSMTPKRDLKWIQDDNKGTGIEYISDTSAFANNEQDRAGGLRVDYVLPSKDLEMVSAKVFWPHPSDKVYGHLIAVSASNGKAVSSDHRLVYVDLKI